MAACGTSEEGSANIAAGCDDGLALRSADKVAFVFQPQRIEVPVQHFCKRHFAGSLGGNRSSAIRIEHTFAFAVYRKAETAQMM